MTRKLDAGAPVASVSSAGDRSFFLSLLSTVDEVAPGWICPSCAAL
jgi:hypothetical protein